MCSGVNVCVFVPDLSPLKHKLVAFLCCRGDTMQNDCLMERKSTIITPLLAYMAECVERI